ncbi:MAG: YihY/virulence factor BrkB family protein [Acidobacteria bacterium]|nr:YihY/virulence factor BrkB family protein [Acidobacteriota bacterium]
MRKLLPTLKYLFEVEVHVYAFSIAANVLLSFFPFLLVLIWFARLAGWNTAEQSVYFAMSDLFGPQVETQIRGGINWIPNRFSHFSYTSVLLLLFTANGIFEPLEVALNRAWGITENRSFFKNQLISMGLIFACGSLAILSIVLSALSRDYAQTAGPVLGIMAPFYDKFLSITLTMASLFVIYWVLPNRKIPVARVVPTAITVGLALEALKYILHLIWPWFLRKLQVEYGPFYWAVIIVFVSFLASMIILAGAEWSGRSREPAISEN